MKFTVKVIILLIFAAAMSCLSATVMIYFRELYGNFYFPIQVDKFPPDFILTEIFRESSNVVIFMAMAGMAGKKFYGRLAAFFLLFGFWDIFYYGWLYTLIGWPTSLLEWDVLYIVPFIWTGPVIAPILVSIVMIIASLIVWFRTEKGRRVYFSLLDWLGFLGAGVALLISFFWNNAAALAQAETSLQFPWLIFILGLVLGILIYIHRMMVLKI